MILKIVEGVSSKDTFHVAKTAIDLSIFSQLPFFKNYFLKLLQKLKKPYIYVCACQETVYPSPLNNVYTVLLYNFIYDSYIKHDVIV